jgi:hypothetical protein
MKYLVAAAVTMAALAGPARAIDMESGNKNPTQLHYEKIERERLENEKAYNAQMKRLKAQTPAGAAKQDPWSNVRPTADSAAKR